MGTPPAAAWSFKCWMNPVSVASKLVLGRHRSMRMPEDLSVAGFDDTPIATQVWPTLTTVSRDVTAMAEKGVEILASVARDRALGQHADSKDQVVVYSLIERQSVASLTCAP